MIDSCLVDETLPPGCKWDLIIVCYKNLAGKRGSNTRRKKRVVFQRESDLRKWMEMVGKPTSKTFPGGYFRQNDTNRQAWSIVLVPRYPKIAGEWMLNRWYPQIYPNMVIVGFDPPPSELPEAPVFQLSSSNLWSFTLLRSEPGVPNFPLP